MIVLTVSMVMQTDFFQFQTKVFQRNFPIFQFQILLTFKPPTMTSTPIAAATRRGQQCRAEQGPGPEEHVGIIYGRLRRLRDREPPHLPQVSWLHIRAN